MSEQLGCSMTSLELRGAAVLGGIGKLGERHGPARAYEDRFCHSLPWLPAGEAGPTLEGTERLLANLLLAGEAGRQHRRNYSI